MLKPNFTGETIAPTLVARVVAVCCADRLIEATSIIATGVLLFICVPSQTAKELESEVFIDDSMSSRIKSLR